MGSGSSRAIAGRHRSAAAATAAGGGPRNYGTISVGGSKNAQCAGGDGDGARRQNFATATKITVKHVGPSSTEAASGCFTTSAAAAAASSSSSSSSSSSPEQETIQLLIDMGDECVSSSGGKCPQSMPQSCPPPPTSGGRTRGVSSVSLSTESTEMNILASCCEHPTCRNQCVELLQVKREVSSCVTMIHLMKGNIGTGILAMGTAYKLMGLFGATVGLAVIAGACTHCMSMLVKSTRELQRRLRVDNLTYAETVYQALEPYSKRAAKLARFVINLSLCVTLFGFCCVYMVFVAKSLIVVFPDAFAYESWLWIMFAPILCLVSVRSIEKLKWISTSASILQLAGLVGLLTFLLRPPLAASWERLVVGDWRNLPTFFGTAVYAFEGIGLVLPLQNRMKNPDDMGRWNGVVSTSMILVSCLYISVGFYSFLMFGPGVMGSVTLNLSADDPLSKAVILAFAVAIFLTYAIQFYVPVTDIILPWVSSELGGRGRVRGLSVAADERLRLATEAAVRLALVIFTFTLAAVLPRLDALISLVGACSAAMLALIAPPVVDMAVHWQTMGPLTIAKNILMIICGLMGLLFGTRINLIELLRPDGAI